jgi:CubicO group peptidase (beta-lactamase class C family)
MKISTLTFIALFIGVNSVCLAQNNDVSQEVKENITSRVLNGINTGIVVGVITSEGTTFFSSGVKSLKTNEAVDEKSVFEVGSISKTFTGILLADMVKKGDLSLEDPLQSLLPEGVIAPTRNEASIKLYQLSNHTSSLPRMPDNFNPTNPANPFADYSEEQLYAFLNAYELTRDIGSEYEYSNYAAGLLGYVLAAKRELTYEELMMEVITNPLGMENTSITLSPSMKENLAMGHSNGAEVENWDIPTLSGAGAIRSTAVDMLKYLAANMGMEKSSLYPAMQLSHKNSRSEGSSPIVGLGWHTTVFDKQEIVWHNGGTGGYRTFAGFTKGGDIGVVVLSNSNVSVDDIGIHLLHPASDLDKPKPSIGTNLKHIIGKEGIEIGISTYWKLKENQPNDYDFGEDQLNMLGYFYLGQEEIEKAISVFKINTTVFPNSSNVHDSYGEALMKNEENEKAIASYRKSAELNPANTNAIDMLKKLGVDTEGLLKEVTIEDVILESYVGKYQLAPEFIITVTKDGKQMNLQATGQPKFGIFPKSETTFYLKVVDAQVVFNKNEDGKVESLTLFQGGQEITGARLED